jgi:predicted DCC family thiol-disulfide oxidoreductase YuxK
MTAPALIVFDGTCGFCRHVVHHLAARWHLAGRPVPWQATDLDALGLSEPQARARMWYAAPGVAPAGGAAAFAAWLATGDRPARLIAAVLRTPGVRIAAEGLYRVVARGRHRIPGPWEHTCTV